MPTFAYSGRTRAGQTVSGERVADTMDAAVAALRREQILVTQITPAKAKAEAAGQEGKVGKTGKKVVGQEPGGVHAPVLGDDRRRPAAGAVPRHSRHQEEDKNFAAVILADAHRRRSRARRSPTRCASIPKTFDPLFTNMIAAGEAGGILDTILKRLATYIEKAVKLKGQVKSAMIYPIAVIVIAGVVVGVILWKVIPTFATLFAGLGAELPLPTRVVIALSNNLVALLPVPARRRRRRRLRLPDATTRPTTAAASIDATMLKLPVLGNIMRKIAVARFCRTLSTLISSGVPILDGLEITAKTAGNAIVEDAIMATRKSIERGETIAAPLKETDGVPADGDADDRRRRGDRRARHDARRRSPTSTRRKSTPRSPGC